MFRRSHALALLLGVWVLAAVPLAQAPSEPPSDAAMEQFLRKARIVRTQQLDKGVTRSLRATLSDGTLTHDAHIQTVDQSKFQFRTAEGVEFNFRDSWTFNIAAYKIDRLLGLHLVPVSVPRHWGVAPAAFTWWVDDVMMDEGQRLEKDLHAPNTECWNGQVRLMRLFDQLIDNVDRNLGNMLITHSWRLWAIDHTRAFRRTRQPRNPALVMRVDRTVLQRLQALDFPTLKREVGKHLNDGDIRALLSRRDGLVAHLTALGDTALYDRAAPSAGCR